jgi:hypothetical protein
VFDGPFELARVGDDKTLFSVTLTSASKTLTLGTILARLGGPPVADLS